jgi:hypothetical protein
MYIACWKFLSSFKKNDSSIQLEVMEAICPSHKTELRLVLNSLKLSTTILAHVILLLSPLIPSVWHLFSNGDVLNASKLLQMQGIS